MFGHVNYPPRIYLYYYRNSPPPAIFHITLTWGSEQGQSYLGAVWTFYLLWTQHCIRAHGHTHWECDVGINVIAPGGGARPRSGTKEAVCENCVLVLLLLSSLPPARVGSPLLCLSLSFFLVRLPQFQCASGEERSSAAGKERAARDA